MSELGSNFEAFRYWLGELWTTRPWLGVMLMLSVVSIPIGFAWLGKLRRLPLLERSWMTKVSR